MGAREKLYAETAAGGFTRVDGTVAFYTRVNALLRPEMTVLDFGAGRGRAALEDRVEYRRALRDMRGKVARVIGVDVDPVVLSNPTLDRAVVSDGAIPVDDVSIDLIFSDFALEHLEWPELTAAEIDRVLKPGGWLCARTTNRWGYVAVAARMVPERLHSAVLSRAQSFRQDHDVFPTFYRLNTKAAFRRYFPLAKWRHYIYSHNAEPAYFGNSVALWRLVNVACAIAPTSLGNVWLAFLQKVGGPE